MFYKFNENSQIWDYGYTICLPSGEILNEANKVNSDGWEWMDSHPDGFIENNL